MFRRMATVIVASLLVMLPAAPSAQAFDPTPKEQSAALQVADLPAGAEIEEVDFASGGTPDACLETAMGADPSGAKAKRSIVSYAQAPGWSWDSGVYVYSSSSSAAASFEQLRAAAVRKCRPIVHFTEQEEGHDLNGIRGEVATVLKAKSGMPRFVVDGYVTGRTSAPDGDPLDRYTYTVYYRAGKTVVELSASTYLPMTTQEMEATRDLALDLAKRAAGI